jgi:glycosyltransferase involved in cell wall biosynthesis
MSGRLTAMAISDSSLGFGSPQIPAFMQSIAGLYAADVLIVEPDTPDKPPRHDLYPDVTIRRIYTDVNPFTTAGRIQYVKKAAEVVNHVRPDILVIFCTFSLPALVKLNRKPRLVIYYAIESIMFYGWRDVIINRALAPMVDLIVFPEENRAANDLERCGFHHIPLVVLYNCSNQLSSKDQVLSSQSRNGRVISQGTIASEWTFAQYYLDARVQRLPIDLFGPIVGRDQESLRVALNGLGHNTRYLGQVDLQRLTDLRREYSFSVVIWSPTVERGLFAPSNKFFEAIAEGVPPITAPHPQHKMFVDRYDCGLVMESWELSSFYKSIRQALRFLETDRYAELVENCRAAVAAELNWDAQFAKVQRLLPPRL